MVKWGTAYPTSRRNFFLITFNWVANALVYNGLSYYSANLRVSSQRSRIPSTSKRLANTPFRCCTVPWSVCRSNALPLLNSCILIMLARRRSVPSSDTSTYYSTSGTASAMVHSSCSANALPHATLNHVRKEVVAAVASSVLHSGSLTSRRRRGVFIE